ncbi:MAG: hypothetical protein WBP72_05910, partial [Rhodocyclaceae bacterium]
MDTLAADLFILALAWLAYFLAHSFLASLAAKRWIAAHHPAWMPRYRIAYNAFATVSALPIAWLFYRHPGPMLWEWTGWQAW